MKKYFDVHVFFSRNNGYSIPVEMESSFDVVDDEDVINHAVENELFTESGDESQVDYVQEIDESEYLDMKGV